MYPCAACVSNTLPLARAKDACPNRGIERAGVNTLRGGFKLAWLHGYNHDQRRCQSKDAIPPHGRSTETLIISMYGQKENPGRIVLARASLRVRRSLLEGQA